VYNLRRADKLALHDRSTPREMTAPGLGGMHAAVLVGEAADMEGDGRTCSKMCFN
jgi:hypothetical protein